MVEIRFHGRGGQGAVVASNILAAACFLEGRYVQAFPAFGVERRGAPVEAYIRIDHQKIHLRTNVYTPDHVVVLDPTLIEVVDVTRGLKPGATLLLNTDKSPDAFPRFASFRVATVDASRIALRHRLGSRTHPIVNTAILGAFARATGLVSVDAVCEAIREEVPSHHEANIAAAREAYDSVVLPEAPAEAAP
ncbi:2-oxoacid:acceptor oxidoreductase family protein [Deferrisoma camini]|uniref:2-oxoacid:acceptor oxidoreductase family protein n=1 Tax=Deferrisoma camini TaxID=1035120 RepID=UPI00046D29E0|nr:2-oxoacid:acceptor oxidoreductase family protein [Deferrisoma camini]